MRQETSEAPFEASLWAATAPAAPATPALDGDAQAEVCVVGGGYTGLSTALHLAERGRDALVLEAEQVGFGGSGRNAGHCTPTFHFYPIERIRRMLGAPYAERLIRAQLDAAQLVFGLIRRHGIDCEAVQTGYVHAAHRPELIAGLAAKRDAYNAYGKATRLADAAETAALTGSDRYHGAWVHPEGGHLNPLAYARGLARAALASGARVHAGSPVTAIRPDGAAWRVHTPSGTVRARRVVCATGAYTGDYWPGLADSFRRLRVGVLATRPISANLRRAVLPADTTLVDTEGDPLVIKFDAAGRLVTSIFVEGRRGRTRAPAERIRTERLRRVWPALDGVEWTHFWHGDLDMQPRTVPRLFDLAPGVAAAIGLSGRGVPTATMMGRVLADWAAGVPQSDLTLPAEPLRRAPGYMAVAPRAYLTAQRWRDRLRPRPAGPARATREMA